MAINENQIYFNVIEEIEDDVYHFYHISGRKDLIMVYEMDKKRIYSYVYKDYFDSLPPKSQEIIKGQYAEARAKGKIVLFIRDNLRKKFKSFVI